MHKDLKDYLRYSVHILGLFRPSPHFHYSLFTLSLSPPPPPDHSCRINNWSVQMAASRRENSKVSCVREWGLLDHARCLKVTFLFDGICVPTNENLFSSLISFLLVWLVWYNIQSSVSLIISLGLEDMVWGFVVQTLLILIASSFRSGTIRKDSIPCLLI